MRTETGRIINAENYESSPNRFTNIEGGLNRAKDMLNRSENKNKNKYIIFLSDGFPTTYTNPQYRYAGYNPIDPEGEIFRDRVKNYPCTYGTSYSDEGAIRARKKAEEIKNSGITIFSIGVDVGGQTIQQYIDIINDKAKVSAVDRTGTSYEIGSASSGTAYQNWLRNKIGSGYYYDSTDAAGLKNAYDQIYNEIMKLNREKYTGDWITTDPVPTENIEYIGFYDKKSKLTSGNLQGTWNAKNGENTASFNSANSTITWDLSKSGCVKEGTIAGGDVVYTYQLVYRVRLKNENSQFVEGQIYETNNKTTLTYRNFENVNGSTILSNRRTINYKIPSVHGYIRNIEFMKTDSKGNPLSGAEFKLSHDTANCSICRGDKKTSVTIQDFTASSDSNGTVSFKKIPSGHKYVLVETKAPDGYGMISDKYYITVDYDKLSSTTVESKDGTVKDWDKVVVNRVYHELPETGGPGTLLFILSGLFMAMGSLLYGIYKKIVKEKRRET